MVVESAQRVKMLLSQGSAKGGEVCWWETRDGGLTWERGDCLVRSETSTFDVDALVLNGGPHARIVVSEVNEAQDHYYRRLFLLSDEGPVQRPEHEADCLGRQ